VEDARAYEAAGAKTVVVNFEGNDLNEAIDRVQSFAEAVMPSIG
jgi:hypothetical protein